MYLQDIGWWLGGQVLAHYIGPKALADFDANDPDAVARMEELSLAFLVSDQRVAGSENDLGQYKSLDIEHWPLETMTVPTLIIHGNADTNAPYAGSTAAAARIPRAKLITIEGGQHTMIVSHAREIREHMNRFIAAVTQ